jgi:hypothetical protein
MTYLTFAAVLTVPVIIFLAQTDKPSPRAQKKKMVFPPGSKVPEGQAAESSPTPAQEPPQERVQRFFTFIAQYKIDEGYEYLTRGSKIAEKESDIQTLKTKTREAIQVFGEITGHELVARKEVGSRLTSLTYVTFGKNFPLRWRFYFYRPDDQWKLVDIRVDDRLADIFGERDARTEEASQ